MNDAPIDDHQAFLIEQAIRYAKNGDHHDINCDHIDALIADRQALIDATISVIIEDGI